jgi:hypothetical protein
LGGLNDGLFKAAYHVGIALEVNIPATTPTDSGKNNDTIILIMLGLFIINTKSKTLDFIFI